MAKGDTRRNTRRMLVMGANETSKVIQNIQRRRDLSPRARNAMGYVDKFLQDGLRDAERVLGGGDQNTRPSSSQSRHRTHHNSSRQVGGSKRDKHSHSSRGYGKKSSHHPKPPKGYPKPPKGYPVAKPGRPSKFSSGAGGSGLPLKDKIVQKVMDPKVQATVEKGERFLRKQISKQLNKGRY